MGSQLSKEKSCFPGTKVFFLFFFFKRLSRFERASSSSKANTSHKNCLP